MTRRRILRSLPVVALVLGCVAGGTLAAFTAASSNAGNTITAGTVTIADNDAGSAVLSLPAAIPGQSAGGCIAVTYGGTLDAGVRLYATLGGALAPHLTLTVTRGTQPSPAFPSCAGFIPDADDHIGAGPGVVFSGPMTAFPTSYAAAVADPPGAPETWTAGESHVYRFAVTLGSSLAAQGLSQTASFTWEARNL